MNIYVNVRFLTQPLSGVQRYGIECCRQIKKLLPGATFVAPHNVLHKDIATELSVKVIGYNTGHLWEQVDLPMYLLKKRSPPLLSLANTAPLFYSNNFITIHDLAFYHHPEWNSKKFSAWYNILIPRLAFSCKHIFTVSNTIKNEIIKHYKVPAAKISVAYNGISHKMLSAGTGTHKKEKIILSVGTFNIRKNHPNLVKAYLASQLKNEYQLVIIGDKNKVFTESSLDPVAINNANIKIFETLNEDELIAMYRKSEIVASLSLYEGFGIPVLEGLYHGCKVICSGIPVYRELYDGCVSWCNPSDINNITEVLDATPGQLPPNSNSVKQLLEKYSYAASAQTMVSRLASIK